MNFDDTIITRADATVDGEFERDVLHRGSTISLNWTVYSLFVLGAALSWILDGFASFATALLVFPPLIGLFIGQRWMRRRVPLPRQMGNSRFDWLFGPIVLIIWVSGIAYRGFGGALEFIAGTGGGAVIGIILVVLLISRTGKRRAADEERLAAESED